MSVAWDAAGTPENSLPSPAQVLAGGGEVFPGTAHSLGLAGPLRDLLLQGRGSLRV